jgi:hypothetical protein
MTVQSISFPKGIGISGWTASSSRQWLKNHNYNPTKAAHFTRNFIRYRLLEPKSYYTYKTIVLPNGVHLTLIV